MQRPQPTPDPEPIYLELASRMLDADHFYAPRILRKLLDLEEAAIVRELPAAPQDVARKLNLDAEKVEQTLNRCVKTGVCVRTPKGQVQIGSMMMGLQDFGTTNPQVAELFDEEFYQLFARMRCDSGYLETVAKVHLSSANKGRPPVRVVPRWKAIKDIPGVMPCEDIREILKAYDGRLSTTQCGCRKTMNTRGCAVNDGTHPDEGCCIHFDKAADYWVKEVGVGSYRNWEEVLDNLDELDGSPIYHTVDNLRDVRFICNCCSCCCDINWPATRTEGVDLKTAISPSRFLCTVDSEKCSGCEICVGKCPFSAIHMTEGGEKAAIDGKRCMGCGACVVNCADKAMRLKLVRPSQHLPETGTYYVNSGFEAQD